MASRAGTPRTVRRWGASRARSAPPPTPRASSRASACRAAWAASRSPPRISWSQAWTPSRTSCSSGERSPVRRTASSSFSSGADMNAKLYATDGSEKGTVGLPDELFAQPVHEHLLWLAVKRHLGNQRQGTAKVKTRGEVSGGGRKPFKQKGTGRARQGSNTSPLMPGGGRAFGPKPRDYRTEMPKKQRRAALVSALSLRASENAVSVIDGLSLAEPKTSQVAAVLRKLGLYDTRTLLVVDEADERVWESCRNLENLTTTLAHQLNAYDLLAG